MKSRILATLFFSFSFIVSMSQPTIQWQKALGGSLEDVGAPIQQTNDGGYIVAGFADSNDGDASGNHGLADLWVVKLNNTGTIEWQKSLGGSSRDGTGSIQMANDGGGSIEQTNDGGYIVAGTSYSNDGDVSGNHGEADAWVVKLSSIGTIEWQKSLGGSGYDGSNFIQQTNDGGYILAAKSLSNDGDVSGNHGSGDCWVVKLNNIGAIEWQKSLGGSGTDSGAFIQQTNEGGYIVAGTSNSNDGDVSGNHGGLDYWIVKLTSVGAIEWQKSLGGSASEQSFAIDLTNDGGYILSGFSESNDGDVSGNHGYIDYWVVKLNNIGTIEWQKSLGGSSAEMAFSIQQTNDGGYVVAGYSISNDGDVSGNQGIVDYWVVKLTSIGAIEWQKSMGGFGFETANVIQQTNDGGYIVGGYSNSNDGDVSGNHGGNGDYWVVKLSGCQQSSSQSNISSCGPYVSEAGQVYNESTSFNYVLSNANGCDSVVNVNITILPLPSTNISPSNALLNAGDTIQLSANGALTYSWSPDNGLSCNDCPSPFASPNEPTTYIVAGTDENGCISYDSIEVDIRCNEPFIPTIFSPNGKGPASNELLCLYSNCVAQLKFVVFNRWGQQVFETDAINQCWDGTFNGEEAATGVYAYTMYLRQLNGAELSKTGTLVLAK